MYKVPFAVINVIWNGYLLLLALGSIQPLTEVSTRNVPEGKGWPECKADNFTAISEPIGF
jgi:hypothetical protein